MSFSVGNSSNVDSAYAFVADILVIHELTEITERVAFILTCDVIGEPEVNETEFARQIVQVYQTPLEVCQSVYFFRRSGGKIDPPVTRYPSRARVIASYLDSMLLHYCINETQITTHLKYA